MTTHIEIRPASGIWVVRAGGAVLAESKEALELLEGSASPVIYFPHKDVGMEFLEKTDSSTRCPYKGQASYFSIHCKSTVIPDAAWSYESPLSDVAAIAGYLAFYDDKVVVERV